MTVVSKPRYVQVTDEAEIQALRVALSLDTPAVFDYRGGLYADANELRAWRWSQSTSEGPR